MFDWQQQSEEVGPVDVVKEVRLGKLIEQFVFHVFDKAVDVDVVASNIQVFKNRVTIGEIDGVLKYLNQLIHLEIVYKFYLYDPEMSKHDDLLCWIGPNRKDSLIQKLDKLKEKQLPLLFREETKHLLRELGIDTGSVVQRLLFKAQLFLPYQSSLSNVHEINKDCVQGFYLREENLVDFRNYLFYMPSKLDWLIEPNEEVEWCSLQSFQSEIEAFLSENKSPLCWMKSPLGEKKKFFIVWW